MVNSALRNSRTIDSDGDGIPNYYDATPFGGTASSSSSFAVTAAFSAPAPGKAKGLALSWSAAPSSVYRIEVATDLTNPGWQPLSFYTNSAPAAQMVTTWDTNAPANSAKRFYRVGRIQ